MLDCVEENGRIVLKKKLDEAKFCINCFGNLSFYLGEDILCFHCKKGEELLALLACEKGGFLSKKRIAELLWEDQQLDKSMDILYKVYSLLKQKFIEYNIPFPIVSINGEMRLDIALVRCDLIIFEEFIMHKDNIEDLLKAFNVYKAPVLSGQTYNWTTMIEGHYEFCYIELLEYIYQWYLNIGNLKKADFFKKKYDNYF